MSWDEKWHLAGWILFILCAVLYTIAAVRSGDVFSIAGSLVFLIACFVFLVPLLKK
jgi:predicted membrane channel-forming protein YqfA (hemolysin III family)